MPIHMTPVTDKKLLERIHACAYTYAQEHLSGVLGPCELKDQVMELDPHDAALLSNEWTVYAQADMFAKRLFSVLLYFPLAQHYSEQFLREIDKTEEIFVMLPKVTMCVLERVSAETDRLRDPALVNLGVPEEQEALYNFIQRFCHEGRQEKFYFVPNGNFGPTTLQPHHKADLLELRGRGLIHAEHTSNSPWETWLISIPSDTLEVPEGVIDVDSA